MSSKKILAINPGSTSTKVAVYDGENLIKELTLRHSAEELAPYATIIDQFGFRKDIIVKAVKDAGVDIASLAAVIGRGGVVKPIESGVYEVNEALKEDLRGCTYGSHASNLGGLIAADIAESIGVPAYIADPVVVDEMQDVARISGRPELPRVSIFHALNQKAIARAYAAQKGVSYDSLNLIMVHLGGGISVGAHQKGRVIDVNNALDGEGPFSPERTGTVAAGHLVKLCYSGKYSLDEMRKMITGKGGIVAHLGTNDMREVEERALSGKDAKAKLMLDAMSYSVGKGIGEMAAVLHGKVDAIILTGGIAYSKPVTNYIKEMVSFIAEVVVMPGENELEALAVNALRVLEGKETPKVYA